MAIKEKQIQIPEALFTQMAAYILMDDFRTEDRYKTIEKGIYDKIDRMQEHDLYTKYKTAPTDILHTNPFAKQYR